MPCRSPPLTATMMISLVLFCFGAFSLLGDRMRNGKIPPLLQQNRYLTAAKQPVHTGVSFFSGGGRGKCQGHSRRCRFLPGCSCLCLTRVYRLLVPRPAGKLQIQHHSHVPGSVTCASLSYKHAWPPLRSGVSPLLTRQCWSCSRCVPMALWVCKCHQFML